MTKTRLWLATYFADGEKDGDFTGCRAQRLIVAEASCSEAEVKDLVGDWVQQTYWEDAHLEKVEAIHDFADLASKMLTVNIVSQTIHVIEEEENDNT